MARLFIALWPPDAVAAALRALCEASGAPCKDAARLHLTLHFLGNLQRAALPRLQSALGLPFEPFELCFQACHRWPQGLLVTEPERLPPALLDLRERLARVLQAAGLRTDGRPFRPHVTLARRRIAPAEGKRQDAPALRWPVQEHCLVESLPGGYRLLQRTTAAGIAVAQSLEGP